MMKLESERINMFNKNYGDSVFFDENLIKHLGGRINNNNVLAYFSKSIFFINESINNICSSKGEVFEINRFAYKGVEYTIVSSSEEDPIVIAQSYRLSPSKTEIYSYYFCWSNGEIKQAPSLFTYLSHKVKSISKDCEKVLEILSEE